MLDQEEKIINAQKRSVNVQYSALSLLGFIIFYLMTKMESFAELIAVGLRQFERCIAANADNKGRLTRYEWLAARISSIKIFKPVQTPVFSALFARFANQKKDEC